MAKKDTTKEVTSKIRLWNVQFADDYAVITATSVPGTDEETATDTAIQILADYYDIDVSGWWLNDVEELC